MNPRLLSLFLLPSSSFSPNLLFLSSLFSLYNICVYISIKNSFITYMPLDVIYNRRYIYINEQWIYARQGVSNTAAIKPNQNEIRY